MSHWIALIAQMPTPAGPAGPGGGAPPTGGGGSAFFPMALMFGLIAFMLLTMRSQKRREKRDRAELFAKLSKNDRVLTVGGVIGTVVSVKENEVLLKVDESTNTKMMFLKSAIQRIVADDQDLANAKPGKP